MHFSRISLFAILAVALNSGCGGGGVGTTGPGTGGSTNTKAQNLYLAYTNGFVGIRDVNLELTPSSTDICSLPPGGSVTFEYYGDLELLNDDTNGVVSGILNGTSPMPLPSQQAILDDATVSFDSTAPLTGGTQNYDPVKYQATQGAGLIGSTHDSFPATLATPCDNYGNTGQGLTGAPTLPVGVYAYYCVSVDGNNGDPQWFTDAVNANDPRAAQISYYDCYESGTGTNPQAIGAPSTSGNCGYTFPSSLAITLSDNKTVLGTANYFQVDAPASLANANIEGLVGSNFADQPAAFGFDCTGGASPQIARTATRHTREVRMVDATLAEGAHSKGGPTTAAKRATPYGRGITPLYTSFTLSNLFEPWLAALHGSHEVSSYPQFGPPQKSKAAAHDREIAPLGKSPSVMVKRGSEIQLKGKN